MGEGQGSTALKYAPRGATGNPFLVFVAQPECAPVYRQKFEVGIPVKVLRIGQAEQSC